MLHNNQKKIAIINDISGFGRCSVAVELPIISVMKIQACPLPTSMFSNHTGFESFFFDDYTDKMIPYMNEWKKLDLQFNGICTGFLGSETQIAIVEEFFRKFKRPETITVIDPVMGDYGKLYSTYNMAMCIEMKKLVEHADIITPNLTEASILTDTEYDDNASDEDLYKLVEKLATMGPEKIVITGIQRNDKVENFCYEKGKEPYTVITKHIGRSRSGTGDIFTAIIAADAVNGVDFRTSVNKAADFISKCILRSIEMDIPLTDGVCFEEFLYELGMER